MLELKSGNETKAVELTNKITLIAIKASSYTNISKYLYSIKKIESAELYIKKSETLAKNIICNEDRFQVISEIAITLFENNITEEGFRLLGQLNADYQYTTLKFLIKKLIFSKKPMSNIIDTLFLYINNSLICNEEKLKILTAAMHKIENKIEAAFLLETINNNFTNVESILLKSELAEVLLNNNETMVIKTIIEDLIKQSEIFYETNYHIIIDYLILNNQADTAIMLSTRHLYDLQKGFALGRIGKSLIFRGEIKRALELIQFIKDELGYEFLLENLILALVEKGEISIAKEQLNMIIGSPFYFLQDRVIIESVNILIKKKEFSIIDNLIEDYIGLEESSIYAICVELMKIGMIEMAFKHSKKIHSNYYKSMFDYYNNINNENYDSKFLEKVLSEADLLISEYEKKTSKMEIGYILIENNLSDAIKLIDEFTTEQDQNEYLENLIVKYKEKKGFKKTVQEIDIILNKEFKRTWLPTFLKANQTKNASFENIKLLIEKYKKHPELLSNIIIEYAAYNSFYTPHVNHIILNKINSIIDIQEFILFVPKENVSDFN
jgi:hypothetical protein